MRFVAVRDQQGDGGLDAIRVTHDDGSTLTADLSELPPPITRKEARAELRNAPKMSKSLTRWLRGLGLPLAVAYDTQHWIALAHAGHLVRGIDWYPERPAVPRCAFCPHGDVVDEVGAGGMSKHGARVEAFRIERAAQGRGIDIG